MVVFYMVSESKAQKIEPGAEVAPEESPILTTIIGIRRHQILHVHIEWLPCTLDSLFEDGMRTITVCTVGP